MLAGRDEGFFNYFWYLMQLKQGFGFSTFQNYGICTINLKVFITKKSEKV